MEKFTVGFFIFLSVLFWNDHRTLTHKINQLEDQISYLEEERDSYSDALDQANSNIEDAQSYAWSSYYDMGDALDNLETVQP